MDVAWSPVHPAVFAAVDIQGKVDIWDLNTDTEIPIVSTQIDGNVAINQVSWTPSGTHITVGDEMGKIWLYDVGEVSDWWFLNCWWFGISRVLKEYCVLCVCSKLLIRDMTRLRKWYIRCRNLRITKRTKKSTRHLILTRVLVRYRHLHLGKMYYALHLLNLRYLFVLPYQDVLILYISK